MRNNQDGVAPVLKNLQSLGYLGAGVGLLGLVIAFFLDRRAFFSSFHFGFTFWLMITLGCTGLTYLHHAIRASWSLSILRVLEAANKTLPLMAGLFVVVALGMWTEQIFPWTNQNAVAASELLQRKAWYLNKWGWTIRAIVFWAFWILTTQYLNRSSARQDKTRDNDLAQARTNRAAPWGVLFVVSITFAYTDWLMSLDPAWYSTIYGVWWFTSGNLSAVALGTVWVLANRFRRPYNEVITPKLTKDLGNMMLGFTMFWAYVSLSQFLIIWSGNLPEEIPFYINRFTGPLVYVGAFLIIASFFTPFGLLLSGRTKREPKLLLNVAIFILVIRVVDVFWQVTPFFKVGLQAVNLPAYALDAGAFFGIGGLWLALFTGDLLKSARANVLIPLHDTRLIESAAEAHSHA